MSVQPATLEPLAAPRGPAIDTRRPTSPDAVSRVTQFARQKPLGAFGAVLIILFLALAIGAQWLAPYPYDSTVAGRLLPPSLAHPFGTDANGRDLLSRVIWGARVSVTMKFVSQILPPSSENACSKRHEFGVISEAINRTRMVLPLYCS